MNRAELKAREEIYLEQYCKTIRTEATIAVRMARTVIFPAAVRWQRELAQTAQAMQAIGKDVRTASLDAVTNDLRLLQEQTLKLEELCAKAERVQDSLKQARRFCEDVLPVLSLLRAVADRIECEVPADLWPLPNYQEILFCK